MMCCLPRQEALTRAAYHEQGWPPLSEWEGVG